jgi:putative intracellular protease/amidase
MAKLSGKRVAILVTDGFEQVEMTDRHLVTSRKPADIAAFNQKTIEEFVESRHVAASPVGVHP